MHVTHAADTAVVWSSECSPLALVSGGQVHMAASKTFGQTPSSVSRSEDSGTELALPSIMETPMGLRVSLPAHDGTKAGPSDMTLADAIAGLHALAPPHDNQM